VGLVLPDSVRWPFATALALRHFGDQCLHPALASLFSKRSTRESVELESPRALVQRTFKRCLRLTAVDGDNASAAVRGPHMIWELISEVYERPLAPPLTSSAVSGRAVPVGFSDADNWELLLWAAVTCATQWHRMQTTGAPQDAGHYQVFDELLIPMLHKHST